MTRPFRVLGVQQIAIGATDKTKHRPLWADLLGAVPISTYVSEGENVDEDILQLGRGAAAVEIDLMQPLDLNKKPRVDRIALNHIGLWVDDLAAAKAWLESQGVRFTGAIRPGATGHDICFIHPKSSETSPISGNGVLIELVQAPPEMIEPRTGHDLADSGQ